MTTAQASSLPISDPCEGHMLCDGNLAMKSWKPQLMCVLTLLSVYVKDNLMVNSIWDMQRPAKVLPQKWVWKKKEPLAWWKEPTSDWNPSPVVPGTHPVAISSTAKD